MEGEEWAKLRKPAQTEMTLARLAKLSERLGERDYLEDRFTAADLMMTTVLRILRNRDVLQPFPNPEAYRERYASGAALGWRDGSFAVTGEDGRVRFVAHHHSTDEVDRITAGCQVLERSEEWSTSMHGNPVRAFTLICRKGLPEGTRRAGAGSVMPPTSHRWRVRKTGS